MPRRDSTNTNSGIFEIAIGSSPISHYTDSTSDATMVKSIDYKTYSINQPMPVKRYYKIGKYYKKAYANNMWLNSGSYYNIASTLVRARVVGYSTGDSIARVDIVWYCAFR